MWHRELQGRSQQKQEPLNVLAELKRQECTRKCQGPWKGSLKGPSICATKGASDDSNYLYDMSLWERKHN